MTRRCSAETHGHQEPSFDLGPCPLPTDTDGHHCPCSHPRCHQSQAPGSSREICPAEFCSSALLPESQNGLGWKRSQPDTEEAPWSRCCRTARGEHSGGQEQSQHPNLGTGDPITAKLSQGSRGRGSSAPRIFVGRSALAEQSLLGYAHPAPRECLHLHNERRKHKTSCFPMSPQHVTGH